MNYRITFTAQDLQQLTTVATAAGNDPACPLLMSVLVKWDGEGVTFTATDSYRLAIMKREGVEIEGGAGSVILRAKSLTAAVKNATKGAVKAGGYRSSSQVTITIGDGVSIQGVDGLAYPVETVEGNYPEISSVIPADSFYSESEGVTSIGLNPVFIGEIAKIYPWTEKGSSLRIEFADSSRPVRIASDDRQTLVIVMPVPMK